MSAKGGSKLIIVIRTAIVFRHAPAIPIRKYQFSAQSAVGETEYRGD